MIKNCQICNSVYERPKHKIGLFCGMRCYGLSKKGKEPSNKGKPSKTKYWLGKKRSEETINKIKETKKIFKFNHSEETKQKISDGLRGVSKGGVSSVSSLIRGISNYKAWRDSVFKRDGYRCVICGDHGVKLNADHFPDKFSSIIKRLNIKTIQDSINCGELWDTKLGRTLCFECHKKTPTFGNRKVRT